MPAVVLVGAQWGDEGKGKATDLLAGRVDYVVKFNGGNNAGHTVVIGDERFALHLLPSGILSPGVVPVIANGTVVDLEVLFQELDALTARGVDVSRLRVSANAHVITQYHRTLDKVTERFLGTRQMLVDQPFELIAAVFLLLQQFPQFIIVVFQDMYVEAQAANVLVFGYDVD